MNSTLYRLRIMVVAENRTEETTFYLVNVSGCGVPSTRTE
ncbi:hypothetical protein TAM4_1612 [Thermococcus sp. AM4]|nr:hypothetical protein TAM4_1612 [Thermococcus sp. AM4]